MSYQEVFGKLSVAISASDSPDIAYLGLSDQHLKDAAAELARHLLALGAQLCYGGDLRADGFAMLLFELVERHKRDSEKEAEPSITDFLAWPVHASMEAKAVEEIAQDLAGIARLICLSKTGTTIPTTDRLQLQQTTPTDEEWTTGLTAMREVVQAGTSARIVVGGRVTNFRGSMPGVAEESLLSLRAGTPLYVLGGFGGCARDIAETLGLVPPWATLNRDWSNRGAFASFDHTSLRNGLSEGENQVLAKTPHIDQALILLLKGLNSIDI